MAEFPIIEKKQNMKNNIVFARQLRKNLTDAERKLWNALRNKQLCGYRFRRQAPLANYIVDFVCHESRLIIELDGSQHAEERNIQYDLERSQWLHTQGYFVQRFWNNDVSENLDGVVDTILNLCDMRVCTPHPFLPPQNGGKGPFDQTGGDPHV